MLSYFIGVGTLLQAAHLVLLTAWASQFLSQQALSNGDIGVAIVSVFHLLQDGLVGRHGE